MNPQKKLHLVFSLLMGAMMFFVMTFLVTAVNIGFSAHFLSSWMKSYAVAYVFGVPVIFVFAPVARRLAARLVPMAQ